MENFSLLRAPYAQPSRTLPVALGQCFASAKLGDNARQGVLANIYATLSPADKLTCKIELIECRAAKRGERLAVVA